jgi:nucleoporin POM152
MKRDDGPAKSFTVIARKPTEIVEIKPPNPGKYEVQFTEFTDSHYPRPVPIKSVRAVQSFHAPSFAALERYTKKLCVGDQVDLEVKLTGSGPWSLAYEVISGAARTSLLIPSISVSPFSFSSPPLNHSGVYYVELKSVLDSNGCETPITSPPAQVEVLDKRPTASFVSPSSPSNLSGANHGSVRYSFIEGKNVGLELFLGGIAPFRVEFEHSIDGNHWKSLGQQKFLMADRSLDVRRPGYYRISQVQDSFCVGSPTEPSLAELIPVEKPSVQLLTGADVRDVCIGRPAGFKVNITGQPPFILRYQDTIECETTGVKCQVDSTERQIRLAQSESEIPFETNVPGLRTVTLLSISDENYNKVELDGLAVGLIVHAEPTARFKGGNEQIHICTKGSLPNDGNLDELILTGQSPWILRIASSFESGAYRKELTEYNLTIPKTPFMFHPHQDFSNVGRYSFALKNVQDANGCSLRLQGGAENVPEHTAKVEVYPEPTLMFIDSRPYSCVGDIMEYHLSGIPPWRIQYRFIDAQGQMHDKNLEVDAKDGAGSDGASSLLSFISRSTFTSGGKKHSSAASDSEQSRRLILRFAQPGSFEFRSICHGPTDGEGWCCKNLTGDDSIGGPHFIHTLPSASINQGKHSMDVIRYYAFACSIIDSHT